MSEKNAMEEDEGELVSPEEIQSQLELIRVKSTLLTGLAASGNVTELTSRANELIFLASKLKEDILLSKQENVVGISVADEAIRSAELWKCAAEVKSNFRFDAPTSNDFKNTKLRAPTFDGDLKSYRSWWEQYCLAVHNNPNKTLVEKFMHLSQALTGKAKKAIAEFSLTKENYGEAIKLLQERFGDPKKLQSIYLSELEEIRCANTADENRANHDLIRKLLTNLTAINTDTDQDILKKLVLSKYSRTILAHSLRGLPKDFSLQEFLEAASKEISLEERLDEIYKVEGSCSRTLPSAVLVGAAHVKPVTRKMECVFCGKTHPSSDCRKYNSLQSRKDRAGALKLCFICLSSGHRANNCDRKSVRCGHCHMSGHAPAMCRNSLEMKSYKRSHNGEIKGTFLLSFICQIKGKDGYVTVRGLLDQGSSYSYIELNLAKRLGLESRSKNQIYFYTFNSSESSSFDSSEVLAILKNYRSEERSFRFLTISCISGKFQSAPRPDIVRDLLPTNYPYADPSLFCTEQSNFQVLIGNDLYHSVVNIHHSRQLPCGVVMINSFFGWLPSGGILSENIENTNCKRTAPCLVAGNMPEKEVNLESMWALDTIGIKSSELDTSEETVLSEFRTSVLFANNRFTVRWPWKIPNPALDSNFRMCLARLKSLFARTSKEVLMRCDDLFNDQLKDGIIERAPRKSNNLIHYIPHRPLIQKDKLRVIYDASAKTKTGKSLNDLLHAGPVLIKNLVGLILNFRLYKVGIIADIEKAFLMVGLNPVDRDTTRFVWVEDINSPIDKTNLKVFRFTRIPFGVVSSPFLLNVVLQELLTSVNTDKWSLCASQSFYVDNLVTSLKDPMDATLFFETLRQKMSSASFNLRDWMSNDESFLSTIPAELRHNSEECVPLLGLNWHPKTDLISFKVSIPEFSTVTKRIALQFFASLYDPMGWIAPTTLPLKAFIQSCWKAKYEWDTPLPTEMCVQWLKLIAEIQGYATINVPRKMWPSVDNGIITLHIFCDASKLAFACCAYLCISGENFTSESSLIFSKIRLSPIKETTIPKLELLAVWLGKRTANFLQGELKVTVSRVILWTDATTILQWLASSIVQPIFIKNRLDEIRRTPNLTIRYVPTKDNPADVASRGCRASSLTSDELWWRGPKWLNCEKLWPIPPVGSTIYSTKDLPTINVATGTFLTIAVEYEGPLTKWIENRFSSWRKYLRLFGNVFKFFSSKIGEENFSNFSNSHHEELAERFLLLEMQRKYFGFELSKLRKNIQPNKDLELFIDSFGIIRCKGRLNHARLSWDSVHPILLPRASPLTRVLVRELHEKKFHIGCNHLLAELRQRFWIKKGRAFVKSIIAHCVICKRWSGGAYKLPPLPPLPLVRVMEASPFLHTGLDYLGPLNIVSDNNQAIKGYVGLFTCLVTRAVHLEATRNLSAEEFLLALVRFTSRRGVPRFIISDNATNFVPVQPLVGTRVELNDPRLSRFVSSNRIQWHFIPQYAPWYGGAYERLVALVKNSLRKSLGLHLLDFTQLSTVLCQIEDTINSRPLTYINEEIIKPLTPNHFLRLRTVNVNEILDIPDEMLTSNQANLISSWKHIMGVVEAFWCSFRSDYLLSLREREMIKHKPIKGSYPFAPQKGDIVLVKEPSAPRADWKYAIILSVDRRQGQAHIKYKGKTQIRTVNQLFPLEVVSPSTSQN